MTSEVSEKFGVRSVSRDEMNLAEFPLTVLTTRVNPKVKTLEFHDTIHQKSGKVVNRHWVITAADRFGLPTATDDEILLGLLKLTVEAGFQARKVFFTRYELLKTLRWSTEGRSYTRLQSALDRLSGVRIKATNAFYDNEAKAYSTRNFGIIDEYEINNGRDNGTQKSFFTWSEVIFKSFQVGFIKKLDLDFYLGLKSAISKRLYRYLDKHFWYKSCVRTNLFTLAHEKIGISRNYKYASSVKQQLAPAIEELIEKGFLTNCEYMGKGKGTEIILYANASKPRVLQKGKAEPRRGSSVSAGAFQELQEQLVRRGLTEKQIVGLLGGADEEKLSKVERIVEYYDRLLERNSQLVSKSPVGFLYRAVERADTFILPGEAEEKARRGRTYASSYRRKQRVSPSQPSRGERLQEAYIAERKKLIAAARDEIEPRVLRDLEAEVSEALSNVERLLSKERFDEAVDHAVNEKLSKLYAVPEFDEWCRQKSVRDGEK